MPSLRATAKICPLKYLLEGEYIVQEGWQPNYVQVGQEKISRIQIIGLVVQKVSSAAFYVDDGTGSIQVIDFNQNPRVAHLTVGDPVLVVGRPRKNEEQLFIAAEIVTTKQLLEEPQWLELRQQVLQSYPKPKTVEKKTSPETTSIPHIFAEQLTGDDVVDFMRKKDTGEGVPIDEITAFFGDDVEEVIHTLLSMGEVYEIRAGVLKVLE